MAARLDVLALLAGNPLEKLRGVREGRDSVRINAQFRVIIFVESYCPVGATTLRLTPSRVFCRHCLISAPDIAGPPTRFTEKRKTASKSPER